MNKNIKKITAITTVASASILFLIMGASAMFTGAPEDNDSAFGYNGTFDISVSELDFDNHENKKINLNPGDCDPYSPSIANGTYRDGTEHEIVYHVENLGTKSARTRHIITLELIDTNSNVVEPTMLMISELEGEFLKEINNTYNSLSHKYYCLEDGTRIEVTEEEAFYVNEAGERLERIGACGLEPSKENISKLNLKSRIIKVQYVIISKVLDGTSEGMDKNNPYFQDPVEIENEVQTTGADYKFYLGMYHQAETQSYEKTSVVAKDNYMYLLEGLSFDENNNIIGTKVNKIVNGYYNEASEYAPDGKMYLASDVVVNGTTISGTEVDFIDQKYRNASLVASDNNIYLVKGLTYDENGNPVGTKVTKNDNKYYIYVDGVRKEVSVNEIMHWDASFREVYNTNPRYYVYTNSEKTEYYEINERDIVHWVKDSSGNATYETIFNGADKYVIASTGVAIKENEIAHWDTNYNLITPTENLGGNEHDKLGQEGASVKVTIEIQAMQYRNTTNDDWKDWTTYSVIEKDYTITSAYTE